MGLRPRIARKKSDECHEPDGRECSHTYFIHLAWSVRPETFSQALACSIELWRINGASSGAGGNSEIARGMAREMASAAWDAISIESGTYLLIASYRGNRFLAYQAYKAR